MQLTEELARNTQHAGNAQTALGNRTLESQMMLGAVGNVVKGAGMGALGGPAGAAIGGVGGLASGVMSAMSTGIQTGANLDSQNIRNEALNEATRSQIGAGTYMQNSNKQLADWAANGDYENTIAGIQARVQDSRLIQPSTSGQFGGDAMNFNNNTIELSARWKMIDPAHVRSIGDYWLRYGYAVSQFADIPASLMVMTKFTYWKLSETYFYSAVVPEAFKQAIRGIFEKGVTVWANANDIGMLDWADNEPLEGITL
jgi:hypothetical protein